MLSRRRAALVSRAALAAAARRLGIGSLLLLGKGEAAAGGEQRPSILAGVFEALAGAIYLSEGYAAAARFVDREHLSQVAERPARDAKTALQEYAQARFKRPPAYSVTEESGPAHAKTFTIAVSVGNRVLGTGRGATKKQAQTEAASQALQRIEMRRGRGTNLST